MGGVMFRARFRGMQGSIDFAFSPAFDTNKYFYVSYTIKDSEVRATTRRCYATSRLLAANYAARPAG